MTTETEPPFHVRVERLLSSCTTLDCIIPSDYPELCLPSALPWAPLSVSALHRSALPRAALLQAVTLPRAGLNWLHYLSCFTS